MVSPHFDVRIVSRGKGRSAVMAAAYQHRAKMTFEREAQLVDFSGKQDLLHEEFVIPADAPEWLRALAANKSPVDLSEIFWNRLENFEKKLDAQLAKDVTLSLPIELSHEQNIALVGNLWSTTCSQKAWWQTGSIMMLPITRTST